MKILVTGGAGFIGSHVADAYIKAGHEVMVFDNLSSGNLSWVNKKAKWYHGSICEDKDIETAVASFKPDIINHHAAQVSVLKSIDLPYHTIYTNEIGTINVIEAAKKHKVKKIIFASSGGAIYGDTVRCSADEGYEPHPVNPYGISKLAAEFYIRSSGINYIILRYANVFGPRQLKGVVHDFIQDARLKLKSRINGNGKQTRNFVYVEDVARANLLVTEEKASRIYNVGGELWSIEELYYLICCLTKRKGKPEYDPKIAGEVYSSNIDWRYINLNLGWFPKVRMERGLERTIRWWKKQ